MLGEKVRMGRFFKDGENPVIVAMDHGGAYGPISGLIDFPKALWAVRNADGILLNHGMVRHCIHLEKKNGYSELSLPLIIIRLNWSSNYVFKWEYHEGHNRQIIPVSQAVALGADAVLGSLFLKTGSEERDTENVECFTQFVKEKRKLGIPLVAEIYPHPGISNPQELHEYALISCRIVAEQGADMIKTFYTGKKFSEIIKATIIPTLVLGGEKTETEFQALELAYKAIDSGARGIIFGRNIIQSKNPTIFIDALKQVVKKRRNPKQVIREFKLDY